MSLEVENENAKRSKELINTSSVAKFCRPRPATVTIEVGGPPFCALPITIYQFHQNNMKPHL